MLNTTIPGRVIGLFLLAVVMAGCQTASRQMPGLVTPNSGSTVLMMTPDVQLFEMQASGVLEPKSEWTRKALENIGTALNEQIRGSGATIVDYTAPTALDREQAHNRLINLHRAVGGAIRQHWAGPLALPSKEGKLVWTLGPGVQALRDEYGADYAFFLHIRDSYASAGRGAVVLAGILLGVPVAGGHQQGFVSLVDLRTGQIVWVNQTGNTGGDLRVADSAGEVVKQLLDQFPI